MNLPLITSGGYVVNTDPAYYGDLRASNDILCDYEMLHKRMQCGGYLFFRDFLEKQKVLNARAEIIEKLITLEEIDTSRPPIEAFSSGIARREKEPDNALEKSLRSGAAVRAVCSQEKIVRFFERFLAGRVLLPNYIWVRTKHPHSSTPSHIDLVFMGRGTHNMYSIWLPLGDISCHLGGLMILEGSHQKVLQTAYADLDVDRDVDSSHPWKCGVLSKDPSEVQQLFGGRWLTADFRTGDIICFSALTIHCSLDNLSSGSDSRIRISCDTSYQLASEPVDERWIGIDPAGHTEEHNKACR